MVEIYMVLKERSTAPQNSSQHCVRRLLGRNCIVCIENVTAAATNKRTARIARSCNGILAIRTTTAELANAEGLTTKNSVDPGSILIDPRINGRGRGGDKEFFNYYFYYSQEVSSKRMYASTVVGPRLISEGNPTQRQYNTMRST